MINNVFRLITQKRNGQPNWDFTRNIYIRFFQQWKMTNFLNQW
ncbi:hypothetical protein [Bacillus sp. FSL K6-3431]